MAKIPVGIGINGQLQVANDALRLALQDELRILLDTWEHENENSNWDVNPTLKRMAEILEEATNDFMQNNPDPMDDRHPIKSHPMRPLGHLLKMITRVESFVNKLVISYLLTRDNTERNILAARLLLNLLPGIDTSVVLADADSLLTRLFQWAETSDLRELRAYSMAILGAGMGAEQAHQYRQNNLRLIPIALQRLRDLYAQMLQEYRKSDKEAIEKAKARAIQEPTNFAHLRKEEANQQVEHSANNHPEQAEQVKVNESPLAQPSRKRHSERDGGLSPPPKRSVSSSAIAAHPSPSTASAASFLRDTCAAAINAMNEAGNSNSSWRQTMQPLLVGVHRLHPLSIEMEQRLILHYLGPTSEYQDNLSIVLEQSALDVVLNYLAMDGPNHVCRDIRLLFDAIRYISSLLIHRKFAWQFINVQGVQRLLRINRQSLALTAVATCLYYLSYSTDIMEKVCHLPDPLLNELMDYALYALDHSHETGRASIALFLSYALQFRTMLDRFDQRDGLRRLYNYVSTLTILNRNDDDDFDDLINDDHYSQSIVTIKHAIVAFKTYLLSHIFLKMEHIKRSHMNRHTHQLGIQQHSNKAPTIPHNIPSSAYPHTKPMILNEQTVKECVHYLIQTQCLFQPHHQTWKPIEDMRNLGLFHHLIRMVSFYPDWCHWERQGKPEALKAALDLLRLATVSPKIQLDFCETLIIKKIPMHGIGLIMEMAEGEVVNDPYVQHYSLDILINCLCNPIKQENHGLGIYYRFTKDFDKDITPKELQAKFPSNESPTTPIIEEIPDSTSLKPFPTSNIFDNKDKGVKLYITPEQIQQILWLCTQQNNAIMILTALLHKKDPPTEADLFRELACRALNGIARFEPVRQILSKLPIIAANELNALMQTPVMLEKRVEHNRFYDQARLLIERVSQMKLQDFASMEMTQENLWRAAVVAQTKIKFNEKELLQLIFQHLSDIGFKKTARSLAIEAELPTIPASRIPLTPASLPAFPSQNASSFANILARRVLRFNTIMSSQQNTPARRLQQITAPSSSNRSILSSGTNIAIGSRLPIKLFTPLTTSNQLTPQSTTTMPTNASNSGTSFSLKMRPHKSLTEIVQSSFRHEHALCRNPVANCPPFSLFYPHHCPEPKLLYSAPVNFINRFKCRSIPPYRCTMETLRQADRRLVFSRFRQLKAFSEENETFTCCQFMPNDEKMFLGTYAGDIFVYNMRTGVTDTSYNSHHSSVTAIRLAKDGLMLTSSAFVKPYSVLWKVPDQIASSQPDRIIDFREEQFVGFANLSTNQIVGTQGPKAVVYDTETATPIVTLFEERLANHYTRNRAYFDPLDELVLNDGILFDPRIGSHGRVVHKFDKMNLENSGIFHPRGTEIIINSEVWDLRTHRLMHTVPALDQCKLDFNSTGTIIFGIVHQEPSEVDDRFFQVYGNYFRTFDATNYEVISTYDTRRPLLDFCSGHSDNFVAAIEVNRSTGDDDTNFCRIYEVGRRRDVDEEDEEEQDEQNAGEDEEDGYSSSVSTVDSSINTINIPSDNEEDADTLYENLPHSAQSDEQNEDDQNSHSDSNDIVSIPPEFEEPMMDEEEGDADEVDEDESDDDDDSSYSDDDYELSSDDFSP